MIIGLAAGAYFFLKVPSEAKEWRNDAGQLHRENDQPAVIGYNESGEIEDEAWYIDDELIKENPPST